MTPVTVVLAAVGAAALPLAADASWSALTIARLTVAGAALGACTATDLAEHRIPNRIVLPAAAACAALSVASGTSTAAAPGLTILATLLLLSLAAPSALGMGDIKLMLVVVLGVEHQALRALLLGLILAGLGAALVVIVKGRRAMHGSLPLAPFLALGSLLAVL